MFCLSLIAVSKCMYSWKGCMFRNMGSVFRNLCVKLWCFETCYVCFETYSSILSLTAINGQISISCYNTRYLKTRINSYKYEQVDQAITREHTLETHTQAQEVIKMFSWASKEDPLQVLFLCIASVKGETSWNKKSHPSSSPHLKPVQRFVHPPVRHLLLIGL